MFEEFKKFIVRGNVIDLAVAVVIGAAFGAITNSFVADIITPPLGLITGGVDFSNVGLVLGGDEYPDTAAAIAAGAPVVKYGMFLNAIINFLMVGGAMFLVVKGVAKLEKVSRKKEEEAAGAPEQPAATPEDVVLLREIRDLLKEQRAS